MAFSSLGLRRTWPAVFWSFLLQRGNVTLFHYTPRQALRVLDSSDFKTIGT